MFVKRQTTSSPLFYSLNILKIKDLCDVEIAKFIFKLKNIPDFNYTHNLKSINQIQKHSRTFRGGRGGRGAIVPKFLRFGQN